MSLLANASTYWTFAGTCAECGRCTKSCSSLSASGLTLGSIAKGMLAADAAANDEQDLMMELYGNEQLVQAVRGCFLCTGCQQTCFANNNVEELIYAARTDFQRAGLIPRAAWSSVQVDQEWDIFTAYRAIFNIGYGDLERHLDNDYGAAQAGFEVAFFPGCSLASYGPGLTREVFATVEELSDSATLITKCCGSSLKSAGFFERAQALLDRIAHEIEASGAKQVVCVCPGCRNALDASLKRNGIACEAVTLVSFLAAHGFKPKKDLSGLKLRMSKSCQDRDGSYLEETKRLLGLGDETPVAYGGCCGAGGAVSAYNMQQQSAQVAHKLAAVQDGETIVTMCPTCTYTYAFHLMANPRDISNKNYLELIFENQFDWDNASAQLNSMWTGEYGPWLAQVFA